MLLPSDNQAEASLIYYLFTGIFLSRYYAVVELSMALHMTAFTAPSVVSCHQALQNYEYKRKIKILH